MLRLGLEPVPTVTVQDASGLWHTVSKDETGHCECCDAMALSDDLDRLSGEDIQACPACRKLSQACDYCGRVYLKLEALAEGCMEEDAQIHQNRFGAWECDECKAGAKEAAKWEGANFKRKQRQEEGL